MSRVSGRMSRRTLPPDAGNLLLPDIQTMAPAKKSFKISAAGQLGPGRKRNMLHISLSRAEKNRPHKDIIY